MHSVGVAVGFKSYDTDGKGASRSTFSPNRRFKGIEAMQCNPGSLGYLHLETHNACYDLHVLLLGTVANEEPKQLVQRPSRPCQPRRVARSAIKVAS